MNDRFEVSRVIPADAATIFAVLCDPHGHLAIDASGSIMAVVDEGPVSGVGDRFVLKMDREALGDLPLLGRYEVTVVITAYEQDREIAWTVETPRLDAPLKHLYGYRLWPVHHGTEVTSYYDWSATDVWRDRELPGVGIARFPVVPESTLRATLGILERTVVK